MMSQEAKIHPYKFSMWLAVASMVMLFGGLTSAYIVRSSQSQWVSIHPPFWFICSTVFVLASSVTLHYAIRAFKQRSRVGYTRYLMLTSLLAVLFMLSQILAFRQLIQEGIVLSGNVAGSFIYLIAGIHLLHILGGLIALVLVYLRTNKKTTLVYSSIGLEVLAIYWHFVDILWVYLVVFYWVMN